MSLQIIRTENYRTYCNKKISYHQSHNNTFVVPLLIIFPDKTFSFSPFITRNRKYSFRYQPQSQPESNIPDSLPGDYSVPTKLMNQSRRNTIPPKQTVFRRQIILHILYNLLSILFCLVFISHGILPILPHRDVWIVTIVAEILTHLPACVFLDVLVGNRPVQVVLTYFVASTIPPLLRLSPFPE